MKFIGCLICVIIVMAPKVIFPQFSYKVNMETGLFINSLESNFEDNTTIYKFLAKINYSTRFENSESSISLKIRPEIFGAEFHTMKYEAKGTYNLYTNNVNWRSIISYQYFNYDFSNATSIYSAFNFVTGASFKFFSNIPTQVLIGYSYQNVDFINRLNSDYYYLDTKFNYSLYSNLNLGYGVFLENYRSISILAWTSNKITKGWYYGPQIQLNYLKGFLVNLDYKLLFLNSNDFEFPSYEHRIKSYAGIILNKYLSFFLLIDFYFRETQIKNSGTNSELSLPTKNENNISAKVNYKIMKNFSLYFKTGYFREEVLSANRKLDGINMVLGLELK